MPAVSSTSNKRVSTREVALQVVRDVFGPMQRGARESLDYRARRAQLDPRDRSFATELAYGSIKMRRLLDWYLEPFIGARAKTLPPAIAEVLRLGTHQLRLMGGVEKHAAVFESVGLARKFGHRGTAGLVNAVLRRVAEDEREPSPSDFADHNEYLSVRYSVPTWIVRHWEDRFGADRLEEIVAGIDQPALISLRVDSNRLTRQDALARLFTAGVVAHPSSLASDIVNLERGAPDGFIDQFNDWSLQSESAAIAVDVLDPQPDEHIIELCSGRGNKTLAIATRMRGTGKVEAVEIDAGKNEIAKQRLADAGLNNVEIIEGEATQSREDQADAILLDAPCSALGILGRQPEARWRKSPSDPERLAELQGAMLLAAARSLRSGGRMVYSVCTTDRRESEEVVDAALVADTTLRRVHHDRVTPPGIERRDGFFVALLERA